MRNYLLTACLVVLPLIANSALLERLGGLAYYDTEAGLTWLADANYAQSSGYDTDGRMSWVDASNWVASLNINGITSWRLPYTLTPDTSCTVGVPGFADSYNCTGSEMGNMYYNVFGGSVGGFPTGHNANYDLFSNIQHGYYWSASADSPTVHSRDTAWIFDMAYGLQTYEYITSNWYSWAVHDGDPLAPVPIPAAVWLFGSGLIGLIGLARRKA